MPNKADIKLNDVKHIFSTLANQKLFPLLKIIHVEHKEYFTHNLLRMMREFNLKRTKPLVLYES
jgi:hypothetical protein